MEGTSRALMDVSYITACIYIIACLLNTLVMLNIMKGWHDRRIFFTLSFSLAVVCMLTCCCKAIYNIFKGGFTPFQAKVFLFWYTAQIHLVTNQILIFTIQRLLTAVVNPCWVRVAVTRRASDKCLTMQWFLMMVLYSPVVMVQFLMKRYDLEELLVLLKDVVHLFIFMEFAVIFLLATIVFCCYSLLKTKTDETIPNQTRVFQAEERRLERYWSCMVLFYFIAVPALIYEFVKWTSSPTLEVLRAISYLGMPTSFIVFYVVTK